MNILFVSENYFPKVSGVPVVVKYLAEGLQEKGHKVSVATRLYGELERNEVINGINIYRFSLDQNCIFIPFGEVDKFRSFIKDFNADVIIVECAQCVTTNALLKLLPKLKCKKIFHSHGFSGLTYKPFKKCDSLKHTIGNTFRWMSMRLYYATFFRKYIKYFDTTLCLSDIDSSKEYLEKYSKGCSVLSNAVDDEFLVHANECEIKLPLKYFVSIANYQPVKNQKGILREYYKTNIETYSMVFIGRAKNEYYNELIEYNSLLEQKYGKRNVFFLYGVARKNIPFILQNAFLYIVASFIEAYSISIIEAMAKGIPFISTNVGNARILPGGITVNSEYEISDAIIKLINSPHDYQLLSDRGRIFVKENCTKEKVIDKINNIISTI